MQKLIIACERAKITPVLALLTSSLRFPSVTKKNHIFSMSPIRASVNVPLLSGTVVHYAIGAPIDHVKPTVLLIPGFMTGVDLFDVQLSDPDLLEKLNLVAVDPLGHGRTRTKGKHWTYWDQAALMIQIMDALAVPKFWVLGIAQGGWIAPRMALLASDKV